MQVNTSFNVAEISHYNFIEAEGKVKQVRVLICLTYTFIYALPLIAIGIFINGSKTPDTLWQPLPQKPRLRGISGKISVRLH